MAIEALHRNAIYWTMVSIEAFAERKACSARRSADPRLDEIDAKNVRGDPAELTTYVVEKGKPLLVMVE